MAETLVILHGWGSDLSRWKPLVKKLKSTGLFVILPGLPQDKVRNIADFSDWLYQKTKTLPPFFLAGHSFGGQIAINFAANHPERVKKLILIASAGIRRPSWKRKIITPLAKLLRGYLREKAKSLLYRLLLATDYYRANPKMRQTMAIILTEDQQKNMVKVKAPTLIIWGKFDHYTPLKDGRLIHELINHSRFFVISDAQHGLPFTHIKPLKEKILWFIGSK
ncbi:MAG: alpha/beta hydrolase [Patescibacteria group bacterium]